MEKIKLILIPMFIVMVGMVYAIPPPWAGVDKGKGAEGHLWLNISGCTPIGEDEDPWLADSCVTFDTQFTLNVSNNDPNEGSYNTTLLIALNSDPSLISVKIDNNLVTGYINDSPNYQGFGKHGIYPTLFAEHDIGFIAMDGGFKTVEVNITPSGPEDMVHFDAVGFDVDGNFILKNPFSHDVTFLPEFSLVGMLLILVVGGIYSLRKRRG